MSAIPSPALALARAFDRSERSGARVVAAAAAGSGSDLGDALIEHRQAIGEVKAAIATVRIADAMWDALLGLNRQR